MGQDVSALYYMFLKNMALFQFWEYVKQKTWFGLGSKDISLKLETYGYIFLKCKLFPSAIYGGWIYLPLQISKYFEYF